MPRTARIVIPNYPHHIIQRGHKRQTVFTSDDDYCHYLDNLSEWKDFYKCTVSDKERELSKQAVQREQLTGGAAFIDEIEAKLQRRIEFRKRG